MADKFVFEADFNLNVPTDVLKRMEGSLAKTGMAYEKEAEKAMESRMENLGNKWKGIAGQVITSSFNPLISAQEQRARFMPKVAGGIASLVGTRFAGAGLSEETTERIAQAIENAVGAAMQRSAYVHGGARENVAGYVAQMSRLGMQPSDETVTRLLKVEKQLYEREYEGREQVARLSSSAFGTDMEQEIKGVEGAVNAAIRNFENHGLVVAKMLEGIGNQIISQMQEIMAKE